MLSAATTARSAAVENTLLEALRAGDERAYAELIRQMYPGMRRLARAYVSSDAVAEEVVQETWLAVVSGVEHFEGRSALKTWIYSILTNQAKSRGARERRTMPFSSARQTEDAPGVINVDRFQSDEDPWPGHWAIPPRPWTKPDRRLLALEMRDQLKKALEQLPERQRIVVILRDVEGLDAEEVCDLLSLSAKNQRVILHRGRARLRSILEDYAEGT